MNEDIYKVLLDYNNTLNINGVLYDNYRIENSSSARFSVSKDANNVDIITIQTSTDVNTTSLISKIVVSNTIPSPDTLNTVITTAQTVNLQRNQLESPFNISSFAPFNGYLYFFLNENDLVNIDVLNNNIRVFNRNLKKIGSVLFTEIGGVPIIYYAFAIDLSLVTANVFNLQYSDNFIDNTAFVSTALIDSQANVPTRDAVLQLFRSVQQTNKFANINIFQISNSSIIPPALPTNSVVDNTGNLETITNLGAWSILPINTTTISPYLWVASVQSIGALNSIVWNTPIISKRDSSVEPVTAPPSIIYSLSNIALPTNSSFASRNGVWFINNLGNWSSSPLSTSLANPSLYASVVTGVLNGIVQFSTPVIIDRFYVVPTIFPSTNIYQITNSSTTAPALPASNFDVVNGLYQPTGLGLWSTRSTQTTVENQYLWSAQVTSVSGANNSITWSAPTVIDTEFVFSESYQQFVIYNLNNSGVIEPTLPTSSVSVVNNIANPTSLGTWIQSPIDTTFSNQFLWVSYSTGISSLGAIAWSPPVVLRRFNIQRYQIYTIYQATGSNVSPSVPNNSFVQLVNNIQSPVQIDSWSNRIIRESDSLPFLWAVNSVDISDDGVITWGVPVNISSFDFNNDFQPFYIYQTNNSTSAPTLPVNSTIVDVNGVDIPNNLNGWSISEVVTTSTNPNLWYSVSTRISNGVVTWSNPIILRTFTTVVNRQQTINLYQRGSVAPTVPTQSTFVFSNGLYQLNNLGGWSTLETAPTRASQNVYGITSQSIDNITGILTWSIPSIVNTFADEEYAPYKIYQLNNVQDTLPTVPTTSAITFVRGQAVPNNLGLWSLSEGQPTSTNQYLWLSISDSVDDNGNITFLPPTIVDSYFQLPPVASSYQIFEIYARAGSLPAVPTTSSVIIENGISHPSNLGVWSNNIIATTDSSPNLYYSYSTNIHPNTNVITFAPPILIDVHQVTNIEFSTVYTRTATSTVPSLPTTAIPSLENKVYGIGNLNNNWVLQQSQTTAALPYLWSSITTGIADNGVYTFSNPVLIGQFNPIVYNPFIIYILSNDGVNRPATPTNSSPSNNSGIDTPNNLSGWSLNQLVPNATNRFLYTSYSTEITNGVITWSQPTIANDFIPAVNDFQKFEIYQLLSTNVAPPVPTAATIVDTMGLYRLNNIGSWVEGRPAVTDANKYLFYSFTTGVTNGVPVFSPAILIETESINYQEFVIYQSNNVAPSGIPPTTPTNSSVAVNNNLALPNNLGAWSLRSTIPTVTNQTTWISTSTGIDSNNLITWSTPTVFETYKTDYELFKIYNIGNTAPALPATSSVTIVDNVRLPSNLGTWTSKLQNTNATNTILYESVATSINSLGVITWSTPNPINTFNEKYPLIKIYNVGNTAPAVPVSSVTEVNNVLIPNDLGTWTLNIQNTSATNTILYEIYSTAISDSGVITWSTPNPINTFNEKYPLIKIYNVGNTAPAVPVSSVTEVNNVLTPNNLGTWTLNEQLPTSENSNAWVLVSTGISDAGVITWSTPSVYQIFDNGVITYPIFKIYNVNSSATAPALPTSSVTVVGNTYNPAPLGTWTLNEQVTNATNFNAWSVVSIGVNSSGVITWGVPFNYSTFNAGYANFNIYNIGTETAPSTPTNSIVTEISNVIAPNNLGTWSITPQNATLQNPHLWVSKSNSISSTGVVTWSAPTIYDSFSQYQEVFIYINSLTLPNLPQSASFVLTSNILSINNLGLWSTVKPSSGVIWESVSTGINSSNVLQWSVPIVVYNDIDNQTLVTKNNVDLINPDILKYTTAGTYSLDLSGVLSLPASIPASTQTYTLVNPINPNQISFKASQGNITTSSTSTSFSGNSIDYLQSGDSVFINGAFVGIVNTISSGTGTFYENAKSANTNSAFSILRGNVTGVGDVSVAFGSHNVSGVGTTFTNYEVGDILTDNNNVFIGIIQSINSNTSITLVANSNATFVNVSFNIHKSYQLVLLPIYSPVISDIGKMLLASDGSGGSFFGIIKQVYAGQQAIAIKSNKILQNLNSLQAYINNIATYTVANLLNTSEQYTDFITSNVLNKLVELLGFNILSVNISTSGIFNITISTNLTVSPTITWLANSFFSSVTFPNGIIDPANTTPISLLQDIATSGNILRGGDLGKSIVSQTVHIDATNTLTSSNRNLRGNTVTETTAKQVLTANLNNYGADVLAGTSTNSLTLQGQNNLNLRSLLGGFNVYHGGFRAISVANKSTLSVVSVTGFPTPSSSNNVQYFKDNNGREFLWNNSNSDVYVNESVGSTSFSILSTINQGIPAGYTLQGVSSVISSDTVNYKGIMFAFGSGGNWIFKLMTGSQSLTQSSSISINDPTRGYISSITNIFCYFEQSQYHIVLSGITWSTSSLKNIYATVTLDNSLNFVNISYSQIDNLLFVSNVVRSFLTNTQGQNRLYCVSGQSGDMQEISTGTAVSVLPTGTFNIDELDTSPDGTIVYFSNSDGHYGRYDIATGQSTIRPIPSNVTIGIGCVPANGDNSTFWVMEVISAGVVKYTDGFSLSTNLYGNSQADRFQPAILLDSLGNEGTVGQFLQKTATGTQWVNLAQAIASLKNLIHLRWSSAFSIPSGTNTKISLANLGVTKGTSLRYLSIDTSNNNIINTSTFTIQVDISFFGNSGVLSGEFDVWLYLNNDVANNIRLGQNGLANDNNTKNQGVYQYATIFNLAPNEYFSMYCYSTIANTLFGSASGYLTGIHLTLLEERLT